MAEKSNIEIELAKQAGPIFEKGYDDLLHPSVESIGTTISFLPRTIRLWLGKWEKWIINGEESIRLTAEAVREKAKEIPDEKLSEPEPYVAIPVIQQLSYCYDSEELREMYANLLVSSMNIDTKNYVHPAFAEIIKQLTPDEAKLIKKISTNDDYPLIDIRINVPSGGFQTKLHNFTNISEGVCENPNGILSYLENFIRLGLITIPTFLYLTDEKVYYPLEQHPLVQNILNQKLPEGYSYEISKGEFRITPFGRDFINTCIIP